MKWKSILNPSWVQAGKVRIWLWQMTMVMLMIIGLLFIVNIITRELIAPLLRLIDSLAKGG